MLKIKYYSRYVVLFVFLPQALGVIVVNYLKGIPRLGSTDNWDFYFRCSSEGNILRWEINGVALNGFKTGDVSRVQHGPIHDQGRTINYTTNLMSVKPSGGAFRFDSMLIVSLPGNYNLQIVCRNESNHGSSISNEGDMGPVIMEINTTAVYLQHVFTNEFFRDVTAVFVCGVENQFMRYSSDSTEYNFNILDHIGDHHQENNQTTVKQQAILFAETPYTLIAVFFVSRSAENIMCGYSNQILRLPVNPLDGSSTASWDSSQTSSPLSDDLQPTEPVQPMDFFSGVANKKDKANENDEISGSSRNLEMLFIPIAVVVIWEIS